jgi:hypothetical protein
MMRRYGPLAALLICGGAAASELSYTFVDLSAQGVETTASGTQIVGTQAVAVGSGEGDGLGVGGQLAVGRQFYVGGQFRTAVVDVNAVVTSPLVVEPVAGNFDLITSRVALGYARELRENMDVFAELAFESVEYDFGSFAGENFDTDDSGAGMSVGARWNPVPALEIFGAVRYSAIGEAGLSTRTFESATSVAAGLRWYFFEDLGLGFDYEFGDVDALSISLRFGFGEMRVGGN